MAHSFEEDTRLDHMCRLQFDGPTKFRRLTKLVCSIASSSRSVETLRKLMMAGLNMVRLNFSYDSHEYHEETIENVKIAATLVTKELGFNRHVAIALDLKGPEIRIGLVEAGEVELRKNDTFRLSINKDLMDKGNRECVYIDYENVIMLLQPGNHVYINDGAIDLIVKESSADTIICQVERGGIMSSRLTVCLPGVMIDLPPISEKDRFDLKFGVDHNVDFIFASKVRHPSAIKEIRNVLGEKGKGIMIVAKLEGTQILNYLDETIAAADGIIVDSAQLSIEIPPEKIFLLQKAIVARCNRVGKPVISTRFLDSMRFNMMPTRSEISELATAVLDGADCVLMAGETAVGNFPVEACQTAAKVCAEAECAVWYRNLYADLIAHNPSAIDAAHAVAISAVDASNKSMAAAIVVLTTSGRSAYLLSRYRPRCPIIAVTRCSRTTRQTHLYRGIIPLLFTEPLQKDWIKDVDLRVQYALLAGKKMGLITVGDSIIIVSPWKEGAGFTNNMRVAYAFFEQEPIDCLLKIDSKISQKTEKRFGKSD